MAGAPLVSFTGQRQELNWTDYDFPAREYSPIMARWWTPDPAGLAAVDPPNPQSWNRYAYALGNPATNTDPTGLIAVQPCQSGGGCTYDDNGCTVDGMSVPCNLAENWNSMPGGGGIVQCPNNDCDGLRAVEGYEGSTIWEDSTHPTLDPSGPPSADGCRDAVVNAVDSEFGTSVSEFTLSGGVDPGGGEYSVTLTANSTSGLTAQQFNAIQTGRYASVLTMVTGIGPALHVTGATDLDPGATFTKDDTGGFLSLTPTAHIDTGYAYNPIGALVHFVEDVLNPGTRNPCK